MPMLRRPPLVLAALMAITLAACGAASTATPAPTIRPAAPTYTPMPTFTAAPTRLPSTPLPMATPTVASPGAATATAALIVKDWERATIAEAAISLDVPKSWRRLSMAWTWSINIDGGPYVGANWADAGQGREPTAMLPANAVSLAAQDIILPWGKGMVYTVQVVAGKATAYEAHAIIRVGDKRDYDFYASAPTQAELGALRLVLQHMLESVSLMGG